MSARAYVPPRSFQHLFRSKLMYICVINRAVTSLLHLQISMIFQSKKMLKQVREKTLQHSSAIKRRTKAKEEAVQVERVGVESLPNARSRVELQNQHIAMAHVSGKMRMNFISILPGDKVMLELSPYDLTRGRIIYRVK